MRKPRAVIFDDEAIILTMFTHFFMQKGFEVLTFDQPVNCPIYHEEHVGSCSNLKPCADIMITDYKMPRMNGLELLQCQSEQGCGLNIRNKAIISGFIPEEDEKKVRAFGCAFFQKPVDLIEFASWLNEREKYIDLSRPVGIKRKEPRRPINKKIIFNLNSHSEIFEGTVVNISNHGFCMKINNPLLHGQTVKINTEIPNSCQKAVVQWVKQMESSLYMTGLRCS